MIWVLLLVITLVLFYYLFIMPQLYWKNKNIDQGPPIPFLGDNLLNFFRLETSTEMLANAYNRNKNARYVGMYLGTTPVLLLRDPDLIKQIAVKDFDHFVNHQSLFSEQGEPIWSKILFLLKGDLWREMRATLTPTFTTSNMRKMFSLMEESAQQFVNFYVDQKKNVIELELKDSLTRFANDVIANCAFGLSVDSLKEPNNLFYANGKDVADFSGFFRNLKIMSCVMLPAVANMFKIVVFHPETTMFFKKIVMNTLRKRKENNIIRPDMINLLLKASKDRLKYKEFQEKVTGKNIHAIKSEMTDDYITAQVLLFFFAGFESISKMLTFIFMELAVNSDIQKRLRDEVDTTFKECNGKLTYDELNKMKYMDMVISESMRKESPILATDRICTKAYTIEPKRPGEQPLHLKPGDWVWLPIPAIHRDPVYYPNPEKFDPERFSDENKDNIQPYTYFPFGVGPRNCIGSRFALMECKTLLFHILSKFELTVIDRTSVPLKLSKSRFIPYIEGSVWVGLKTREKSV